MLEFSRVLQWKARLSRLADAREAHARVTAERERLAYALSGQCDTREHQRARVEQRACEDCGLVELRNGADRRISSSCVHEGLDVLVPIDSLGVILKDADKVALRAVRRARTEATASEAATFRSAATYLQRLWPVREPHRALGARPVARDARVGRALFTRARARADQRAAARCHSYEEEEVVRRAHYPRVGKLMVDRCLAEAALRHMHATKRLAKLIAARARVLGVRAAKRRAAADASRAREPRGAQARGRGLPRADETERG